MKQAIENFTLTFITNTILIGLPAMLFIQYLALNQEEPLPVSEYFKYESVEPTKLAFEIGEDITFKSKLERFKAFDQNYNDTLYCGYSPDDFFWYSQSTGETKNAPKGIFERIWRYEGEIPTVPLYCQLISRPFAKLKNGSSSEAQEIETQVFRIVDSRTD